MGPLAIRIEIFPPDQRCRDCDNVLKPALDAMQHGGLFWDDSQVVWLLTVKRDSQGEGELKVQLVDVKSESLTELMGME